MPVITIDTKGYANNTEREKERERREKEMDMQSILPIRHK